MDIDREIRELVNLYKRVQNILKSDRFVELYHRVSSEERKKVDKLAREGKEREVELWMASHLQLVSVWDMSLRELRKVGQRLGIYKYQFLSKDRLQQEIAKHGSKASSSAHGQNGT